MDISGVRIVIPHRGRRAGKSRLATVLTPDERAALNGFMLDKVTRAARAVVPDAVLISPDGSLAATARRLGLRFMLQSGGTGMNHALEQARAEAVGDGIHTLAVLSADLPDISTEDVQCLMTVARADPERSITIAPDAPGRGTNALVLRPPDAIPFRFGLASREAHFRECAKAGIAIASVHRPGLARDLDLPSDLRDWISRCPKYRHVFKAPNSSLKL